MAKWLWMGFFVQKALLTDGFFGAMIILIYTVRSSIYKYKWSSEAEERISDRAWCS
jgi:hypothetical protein